MLDGKLVDHQSDWHAPWPQQPPWQLSCRDPVLHTGPERGQHHRGLCHAVHHQGILLLSPARAADETIEYTVHGKRPNLAQGCRMADVKRQQCQQLPGYANWRTAQVANQLWVLHPPSSQAPLYKEAVLINQPAFPPHTWTCNRLLEERGTHETLPPYDARHQALAHSLPEAANKNLSAGAHLVNMSPLLISDRFAQDPLGG